MRKEKQTMIVITVHCIDENFPAVHADKGHYLFRTFGKTFQNVSI